MKALKTISRPALRYYGGKWRLAPWIISHFPSHICYLEPCFGGGSVLLQKHRSKIETVNDIDNNVVNYFQVLRDHPKELIQKIGLTPWAKEEIKNHPNDTQNSIEKARRFWVQCWMTIAQTDKNQSFRVSKKGTAQPAAILLQTDYLYEVAKRLQGVQVENMDALEFIKKYDVENSLIYFDPPYTLSTRSRCDEYAFEIDESYHIISAKILKECNGKVIVSGYNSALYEEIYKGWTRFDIESMANSQQIKTESIWLSPKTAKVLRKPKQIQLISN